MNGGFQRIAHFLNQNPQRSEQLFHLNYFTIIYLLFKLTLTLSTASLGRLSTPDHFP